jgi:hypothetical protein
MIKCQENAAFPFLCVNGVLNRWQFIASWWMCMDCLYHTKQLQMWCSAFDNSRRDVDDKQWPGLWSMPATVDTECHADAVVREDGCVKLTDMTQERGVLLSSVHSVVYNPQDYWQLCACHVPKYLTVPKLIVCLSLICTVCYYVQGECQSQNTVLSLRVFVTLTFEVPFYILA